MFWKKVTKSGGICIQSQSITPIAFPKKFTNTRIIPLSVRFSIMFRIEDIISMCLYILSILESFHGSIAKKFLQPFRLIKIEF